MPSYSFVLTDDETIVGLNPLSVSVADGASGPVILVAVESETAPGELASFTIDGDGQLVPIDVVAFPNTIAAPDRLETLVTDEGEAVIGGNSIGDFLFYRVDSDGQIDPTLSEPGPYRDESDYYGYSMAYAIDGTNVAYGNYTIYYGISGIGLFGVLESFGDQGESLYQNSIYGGFVDGILTKNAIYALAVITEEPVHYGFQPVGVYQVTPDGSLTLLREDSAHSYQGGFTEATTIGDMPVLFTYGYGLPGLISYEIFPSGGLVEIETLDASEFQGIRTLVTDTFGDTTYVATYSHDSTLRLYEAGRDGTLTNVAETHVALEENSSGDNLNLVAMDDTLYAVLIDDTVQLYEVAGLTPVEPPAASTVPTPGNDSILGTDADERIEALAGADTVFGEGGDDRLVGRKGADSLDGGTGDDSLFGGEYHDTLVGGDGDDLLMGQAGYDRLFGDDGSDVLYGGAGNDTIFGGAQSDRLFGDSGDDYLDGGRGNDALNGGSGNDYLDGGLGYDAISGGNGNDTIFGGNGNDTLSGDRGNDTVFGGRGIDIIDGGRGDDVLNGELGADTLTGGQGRDTFIIADNGSVDTITDFEIGVDTIDMSDAVIFPRNVRFVDDGHDALVTYDDVVLVRLEGIDASDIVRSDFIF
ncbi:calcium-binding protein [Acuticoccus sediminis]|uniref:calcium-binding protein n=1 Tax=Acuticoccus sediminis TaxID=2184697 RepID=UPI001CFF11E6|nr:calcium-binding protein [Acuticoccus sediminis]